MADTELKKAQAAGQAGAELQEERRIPTIEIVWRLQCHPRFYARC